MAKDAKSGQISNTGKTQPSKKEAKKKPDIAIEVVASQKELDSKISQTNASLPRGAYKVKAPSILMIEGTHHVLDSYVKALQGNGDLATASKSVEEWIHQITAPINQLLNRPQLPSLAQEEVEKINGLLDIADKAVMAMINHSKSSRGSDNILSTAHKAKESIEKIYPVIDAYKKQFSEEPWIEDSTARLVHNANMMMCRVELEIGLFHHGRAEIEQAQAPLEHALDLQKNHGVALDERDKAHTLCALMQIYGFLKENHKLGEIRGEVKKLKNPESLVSYNLTLGANYAGKHNWEMAKAHYREVVAFSKETSIPLAFVACSAMLADIYLMEYEDEIKKSRYNHAFKRQDVLLEQALENFSTAEGTWKELEETFLNAKKYSLVTPLDVMALGLEKLATYYSKRANLLPNPEQQDNYLKKSMESHVLLTKTLSLFEKLGFTHIHEKGRPVKTVASLKEWNNNAFKKTIAERLKVTEQLKQIEAKKQTDAEERTKSEALAKENYESFLKLIQEKEEQAKAAQATAIQEAAEKEKIRLEALKKTTKAETVTPSQNKRPAKKQKPAPVRLTQQQKLFEQGYSLLASQEKDLSKILTLFEKSFDSAAVDSDNYSMAKAQWGIAEVYSKQAYKYLRESNLAEAIDYFEKCSLHISEGLFYTSLLFDPSNKRSIPHNIEQLRDCLEIMAESTQKVIANTEYLLEKREHMLTCKYRRMFEERDRAVYRMGLHALNWDVKSFFQQYDAQQIEASTLEHVWQAGIYHWKTNPAPKHDHVEARETCKTELNNVYQLREKTGKLAKGLEYISYAANKNRISSFNPEIVKELVVISKERQNDREEEKKPSQHVLLSDFIEEAFSKIPEQDIEPRNVAEEIVPETTTATTPKQTWVQKTFQSVPNPNFYVQEWSPKEGWRGIQRRHSVSCMEGLGKTGVIGAKANPLEPRCFDMQEGIYATGTFDPEKYRKSGESHVEKLSTPGNPSLVEKR